MSAQDWVYLPAQDRYINMANMVTVRRLSDSIGDFVLLLRLDGGEYEYHDTEDADAIMRFIQRLDE